MKGQRGDPRPLAERFHDYYEPVPEAGCWIWIGKLDTHGYGVIQHERRYHRAHRVSWTLHCGPIPAGKVICHKCDVPACVRPDHLFVGTQGDNIRDCWRKGRGVPGAGTRRADGTVTTRLAPQDVLAIRSLLAVGTKHKDIAAHYGVRTNYISMIATGWAWGYL